MITGFDSTNQDLIYEWPENQKSKSDLGVMPWISWQHETLLSFDNIPKSNAQAHIWHNL